MNVTQGKGLQRFKKSCMVVLLAAGLLMGAAGGAKAIDFKAQGEWLMGFGLALLARVVWPLVSKRVARGISILRHPTGKNANITKLYDEGINRFGEEAARFRMDQTAGAFWSMRRLKLRTGAAIS